MLPSAWGKGEYVFTYADDVSGTLLWTWQCWLSLERKLKDWNPEGQVGIIPHDCLFISGFDALENICLSHRSVHGHEKQWLPYSIIASVIIM